MKDKLIKQRLAEVAEYEFNIRNYELMLEKIGDDVDLAEFKTQVEHLIKTSRIELRKTQIILYATMDNPLDMVEVNDAAD